MRHPNVSILRVDHLVRCLLIDDVLVETFEGHNIADYIDADLESKLEELEREEGIRYENGFYDSDEPEGDDIKAIHKMAKEIRDVKSIMLQESHLRRKVKKAKLPLKTAKESKTPAEMVKKLGKLGIDLTESEETDHFRSRSITRRARKRKAVDAAGETGVVVDSRSKSHNRELSRPRGLSGLRDGVMEKKAKKIEKDSQKARNRFGRQGEGDRHIPCEKPQHLFSGKRGIGKTDRR